MQFQWEGGRKLTSFSTPNAVGNYVYNADGIRVYKEVNGNTTEYYLNGTQIETEITNFGGVTRRVDYIYDENGSIYGFVVDNTAKYYYTKNLQGDVIGILDNTGTTIVEYSYDAWGKATVSYPNNENLTEAQKQANYLLGSNNPFRYRGYYFDNETGFYYLNSRYYDPETGRFINADGQLNVDAGMTGLNLFCYGGNNPINTVDPDGRAFMFLTAAIGAVAGAIVGGVIAAKTGGNVWAGIGIGAVAGGLIGLGAGAAAGVILAGNAAASTAAVMTGASALATTVSAGGFTAGAKMVYDNVVQAVNKAPQVFWSGGDLAKNAAQQVANDIGGKTLEMTKLGQHLEAINAPREMWKAASSNFANIASNTGSAIYSIQNGAGVNVHSIWATIEYPLVSLAKIIYGVVSQDGSISIMP